MKHSRKNFPMPTVETEEFWKGCKNHQLCIQQCQDCGHFQFYPRIFCTECMSRSLIWQNSEGYGLIKSYTVVYRAISKAYAEETPYVIALIELKEGPTIMSNLVNCETNEVKVGMQVEVIFEDWSEAITIPKFQLV